MIIKFYCPGRWSEAAIMDEHHYLLELQEVEVPVVVPMNLKDDTSLGNYKGISFGVFPKRGGRSFDEFNEAQWGELGRLLGRAHLVGSSRPASSRITVHPLQSSRQQVDFLLESNLINDDLRPRFQQLTEQLIEQISPHFQNTESIRIHGDCHFSNIIHRPDESFYLIDFDDMAMGPPVQDLWMLLPALPEDSLNEIDLFLEGYEVFRPFDRRSLDLIEPLRAMRFIHYIAWCGHQAVGKSEIPVVRDFGSRHYWQTEMDDLEDQLVRIGEQPSMVDFF